MSIFDRSAFENPPNEFRPLQIVHSFGASFDWDDAAKQKRIDGREAIDKRLKTLARLGIGGVVANVGWDRYLQDPVQWDVYRYGMRKADELGLVLWWYDEKGYPSGAAGGIVTRANPDYVALGLACWRIDVEGPAEIRFDRPVSARAFRWAGATQDVVGATRAAVRDLSAHVDAQGTLRWQAPRGKWSVLYLAERVCYEGTHSAANVFEHKHFANLLDRDAVAEFIRVTHDRYLRETPPEIWKKVRAVFTDEPSFMAAYIGDLPERYRGKIPVIDAPVFHDRPPAVPWVRTLPDAFRVKREYDLLPCAWALFCSASDEARSIRQDYYETVSEMYADAFYGQILHWCKAHGIASSGHVMAEETLISHVSYHGSLFAPIRRMDLPGIDMLNSDPKTMLEHDSFMTAKQVASVAHITGAKEVHSECSDWCQRNDNVGATLLQRIGQGNLQYVLGINEVTAYWSWNDIGEEAYRAYNDYMGRLSLLLRGGSHVCDVAVLYPIRSAWIHYTPRTRMKEFEVDAGQSWKRLEEITRSYADTVRRLLRAQVDLDILDEQAVCDADARGGALRVADEAYRIFVIPPVDALGLPAARALSAFARAGGKVLLVGEPPRLADSPANADALRGEMDSLFASGGPGRRVSLDDLPGAVRAAGADDLTLDRPNPDVLFTHRRAEGRDLYFIVNNGAARTSIRPKLRVAGPYSIYRSLTGRIETVPAGLAFDLDCYEGAFVVCK